MTRQKKKGESKEESTGASDLSVQKGRMDVYLKPKEDSKGKEKTPACDEEDIQATLKKILTAVKPIDDMNQKLDKLTEDFVSLKGAVDKHTTELSTIRKDLKAESDLSQKLQLKIDNIEKESVNAGHLSALNTSMLSEHRRLKSEIIKLEEYSRRNNLLFHGLDEREGEDCIQRVHNLITHNLNLTDGGTFMISKAHRVGKTMQNKTRAILAQFVLATDVWTILKKKSILARIATDQFPRQRIYITRDYPEAIVKTQRQLQPVLKVAKKIDKDAHIRRDKLIFKGRAVSMADCYKQTELDVEKIGLRENQDVTMFYGRFCPFSNFFPSDFIIANQKYNSVEQYFQKKKADYSGAYSISQQILSSDDPAEMKAIAKQLDCSSWPEELQHQTMKDGLLAKFAQNKRLGILLQNTGTRSMIECNKYDRYWGNGCWIYDKNARNGIGQNKLGNLLQEVRDLID